MQFAKRMNLFGEGIFSELQALKQKKRAEGAHVVDLSVGTPNIPPAPHILKAITEAAADPKNYIYAISDTAELQEAAASWYKTRYGVVLDPKREVVALLGSQEGLTHISLSIVDEGDTVLVPDPCYPAFGCGPLLAGAELAYMPLKPENDYVIDLSAIPEETARRAKLMVVSYPNNPTAALAPAGFYEALVAFARKYGIIVLHDNAYSELVFDGVSCGSFLSVPGAKEVGVEFNSLSKTYGLAGARIGFCVGNAQVVEKLRNLKSNLDYGMFLPLQKGAVAAITGDQSCVAETCRAYEARRDFLCAGLHQIGWDIEKPKATMFAWARIPERFGDDDGRFALELADQAAVLVTPGSAFGPSGKGRVRLALVQTQAEMQAALDAMEASGLFR